MMIEKQLIGEQNVDGYKIWYYFIRKSNIYGIELAQETDNKLICTSELISEVKEDAKTFADKIFRNSVTPTTLYEIIDDYFSI